MDRTRNRSYFNQDDFMAKLEANIAKVGHSVINTSSSDLASAPGMAYTVGLAAQGLPELIVFGLDGGVATMILNAAARLLTEGLLQMDAPNEKISNLPIVPKSVPPEIAASFILVANSRAGTILPAVQLVWPDPQGNFPWDECFDQRFAKLQLALYRQVH